MHKKGNVKMTNSMKILIILPTVGYDTDRFGFQTSGDFPTGLAYVASALKAAGHNVHGLNPNNDVSYTSSQKMLKDKLTAKLQASSYDAVCLGGLCIHFRFLEDSIALIRKVSPKSQIIIGGGIVTDDADFIFQNLKPDFGICGQAEESIVEVMEAIKKTPGNYEHIPNLHFWKDGKAFNTPLSHKYGDIDKRAFPDYSLFDMEDMLEHGGLHNQNLFRFTRAKPRVMSIITALGCPFKCTFCVHETVHRYKERSIPRIMEEIKELYDRYKFNVLIMLDELFAIYKDRFHAICEELIIQRERHGWDFDWMFQTHASANLTLEDLKMLKRAGCYYFSYGIESASIDVLISMKKKSKPEQISNAIELSRKAEIGFGGNFIFGDIVENFQTAKESMSFFNDNCKDMHTNLGVIHPYPGSKLFNDWTIENNFNDADRLSFYRNIDREFVNLTKLPDNHWALISRKIFTLTAFNWEKASTAISCEEEEEGPDTLWAEKSAAKVYKIHVICPHCKKDAYLREVLGPDNRKKAFESAQKNKIIFNMPYEAPTDTQLKKDADSLIELFDSIDTSATKGKDYFNTGCPNCFKPFNVVLNR